MINTCCVGPYFFPRVFSFSFSLPAILTSFVREQNVMRLFDSATLPPGGRTSDHVRDERFFVAKRVRTNNNTRRSRRLHRCVTRLQSRRRDDVT